EVNRVKAATPALNEEGPQRQLSPKDDPAVVLFRRCEDGSEAALVLVNTDDRGRREVDCRALVEEAEPPVGIANFAERMVLAEMLPDGGRRERPARLGLKPLEVKILRATARPIRVVSFAPCTPKQRTAGHHALWRPEARVQIENVYPELDGGRFPVKRVVGDTVEVWADIFRDGHDKIAAVLKYAF